LRKLLRSGRGKEKGIAKRYGKYYQGGQASKNKRSKSRARQPVRLMPGKGGREEKETPKKKKPSNLIKKKKFRAPKK